MAIDSIWAIGGLAGLCVSAAGGALWLVGRAFAETPKPVRTDVSGRAARIFAEASDAEKAARKERRKNGRPAPIDIQDGHALGFDGLAELPAFAKIDVTWAGGNGPHRYDLVRSTDGRAWALRYPESNDNGVTGLLLAQADEVVPRAWIEIANA